MAKIDNSTKIVVLGSGGSYKGSIIIQFVQGSYVEKYDPSLEDSYRKNIEVNDEMVNLEILDTTGAEQFPSVLDLFAKNSHGFVIVFSLVAQSTFNDIPEIRDQIVKARNSEDFPIILVGHRCDLVDQRVITTQQGEALAAKFNATYIEASAKTNVNIEEIFYTLTREILNKRKQAMTSNTKSKQKQSKKFFSSVWQKAKSISNKKDIKFSEKAPESPSNTTEPNPILNTKGVESPSNTREQLLLNSKDTKETNSFLNTKGAESPSNTRELLLLNSKDTTETNPFLNTKDAESPSNTRELLLLNSKDTIEPKLITTEVNLRYFIDVESDSQQALSPFILLDKSEVPCSIKESLTIAYEDQFDEISYECNIPYAMNIYGKLHLSNGNNLMENEFLAIYFYTIESKVKSQNLYSRLNGDLTSKDRSTKVPKWRFYLHHLLAAFRKIPTWPANQDLYRGVKGNLCKTYPEKYKEGNNIVWYGVTSTTTNLSVIKNFLSENEPSTIFGINAAFSGRCIQSMSAMPSEAEVLLPPGSRFDIISVNSFGSVTWIQLKQIATLEKILNME